MRIFLVLVFIAPILGHVTPDIKDAIAEEIFQVCYMGMRSGKIPDSAVTASSHWPGGRHEPYRGRLDNVIATGSVGAWAASAQTPGQWLQIDLGSVKDVAGVITQGRPTHYQQWVTSYKVSCGKTQNRLVTVKENKMDKIFHGNTDMDSKVYSRFPKVLRCRYIRIHPQTFHHHISMRVELVHGHCFHIHGHY